MNAPKIQVHCRTCGAVLFAETTEKPDLLILRVERCPDCMRDVEELLEEYDLVDQLTRA